MTVMDQPSHNRLPAIIDAARRDHLIDLVALALVIALALAVAATMFAAYYSHPEALWRNLWHDRSAHYGYGLDVGIALRSLNPIALLTAVEAIRVWTPLHPIALGTVLA